MLRTRTPHRTKRKRRRLRLESLELRRLLAADLAYCGDLADQPEVESSELVCDPHESEFEEVATSEIAEAAVVEQPELQLSIGANSFNGTLGEYDLAAEGFGLQLFANPEPAIAMNTEVVEDTADDAAIEGTEFEPIDVAPVDCETPIDEATSEIATTTEPLEPIPDAETEEAADDDGVIVTETTEVQSGDTTVNVEVTVNVGQAANESSGEEPIDESTETDETADDAELTLDVIEEVLSDDGFVLVALPADDLQALLNGDFENASFEDLVLLESPPETTSEEIVETQLPDPPADEPVDEIVEDEATDVEPPEVEQPVVEPESDDSETAEPTDDVEDPSEETPVYICHDDEQPVEEVENDNPPTDPSEPEGEVEIDGAEEASAEEDEPAEETEVDQSESDDPEPTDEPTDEPDEEVSDEPTDELLCDDLIQNEPVESDPVEDELPDDEPLDSEPTESDPPSSEMNEPETDPPELEAPETETTDAETAEAAEPDVESDAPADDAVDAETSEQDVAVVGEMFGFVQMLVGEVGWDELRLTANSLAVTAPGMQMVFGGFDLWMTNQAADADAAFAEMGEEGLATTEAADVDSENELLPADDYEQEVDSNLCVWNPEDICDDTIDALLV